ncbi:MAG: hypothetical protein AAF840_04020 [Bacteroidota bacterium]
MPRLLTIILLGLSFPLLLWLAACSPDVYPSHYEIELTDSIRSTTVNRGQVYWTIKDSADWQALLQRADTIIMVKDRMNVRADSTDYILRYVNDAWRSSYPLPGWERHFDTLAREVNVIRLLDNNRVAATIKAADVVLDGDSIRIGIIHVLGRAFDWQTFELNEPDYLMLTTYGNQVVPIAMDQDNIGAISRQTVFRVGRRDYVLREVSEDYQRIVIERTETRGLPLAAELEVYYKQVAVVDLEGNPTLIKRTPGRDLALYFWGLGPTGGKDIIKLDSLYRALPAAEQESMEIVLINSLNDPVAIQSFLTENNIGFRAYKSTPKTCLRLNCHPYVPYYVGVNERGRINTYYGWPQWLEEWLVGLSPEVQGASTQVQRKGVKEKGGRGMEEQSLKGKRMEGIK